MTGRRRLGCWQVVGLLLALAGSASAADFPGFRGVHGWGVAEAENLPDTWSDTQNIAWRTPLSGNGWSQPVIVGRRLFLTVADAGPELIPKDFEQGVKTPQSMGITLFSRPPDSEIEWRVVCIDALDGKLLWQRPVHRGKAKYAIHPSNTFATESPVANAQGIYAHFAACGVAVGLSLDGEPLWQRELGVFKTSNSFGTGSSLVLTDGKVFVQNFTEESAEVLCLDASSGVTLWTYQRDQQGTSWSTPLVWQNTLRKELIVSGGEQVDSLDPASGSLLWKLTKIKAATACSPCADSQRLYFGGSDPFSSGPLFAVLPGAAGDISPTKTNEKFQACAWLAPRAGPGMASPVSSGEFLYVVDKNILRCYAAASGQRIYQQRLPNLSLVAASPLIVGDRLIVIDEHGASCQVAVGPEFKIVGSGSLTDTFWATPAVAHASLYFRGVKALYCVRQSPN